VKGHADSAPGSQKYVGKSDKPPRRSWSLLSHPAASFASLCSLLFLRWGLHRGIRSNASFQSASWSAEPQPVIGTTPCSWLNRP
jgi:hypothetical protein